MDPAINQGILQKVRNIEIRTSRLADQALAGHYESVFKGSGLHFDEVREYIPGDEVRRIDWNVTARTGRPFVKLFKEERELTILLMIDLSASGDFSSAEQSKREIMAELGSVLAFSALRHQDKVGLILFTDRVELYIPPAKGRAHVLRVIREILFFSPQSRKTDLTVPLDFVGQVIRRRAVAFLISDFCLQGNFDRVVKDLGPKLNVTNRRHDLIAVSVVDPREMELPDVGRITIEDAETGDQVELDTGRKEVREGFRRLAQTHGAVLRKTMGAAGADLLEIGTDRPYLPALLQLFKDRERRRR